MLSRTNNICPSSNQNQKRSFNVVASTCAIFFSAATLITIFSLLVVAPLVVGVEATGADICATGCPAGFFFTNCSQGCSLCSPGYYCAGGKGAPVPCGTGTYSSKVAATASTDCYVCTEGNYQNEVGQTGCKACSSVQRSPTGAASCTNCAAGEIGSLNTCTPCDLGYFVNATVSSGHCEQCQAGFACPSKNNGQEVQCSLGSYSHQGMGYCQTCTPGFACPSISGWPVACQAGTFALGGATICTPCPAGSYCPNTTLAAIPCAAGTYALGSATQCTECPAGSACANPAVTPIVCGAGDYSNGVACLPCTAGSRCVFGRRYACDPGSYAVGASQSVCTVCPAGSGCPSTTAAGTLCPAGYFSDAGSVACSSCSNTNGLAVTSVGGSSTCTICPAGSECPNPALAPSLCPAGTFSRAGQYSCTSCQVRTLTATVVAYYSTAVGATSCTLCPPGSACPNPAVAPTACAPGYYSEAGETVCRGCPPGHYCDTGAMYPRRCEAGNYSLGLQTACLVCPQGFYCSSKASSPIQCSSGFFSTAGSESCFECPVGSFCNTNNATANATIVNPCPLGTYRTRAEPNCTVCPAGFMCPFNDQRPIGCPFGYYTPGGQGSINCTVCPAGMSCSNATMAFPCTPGSFAHIGDGICSECPSGYYCPTVTGDPMPCNPGTFSTGSQTACTVCPENWACPSTQTFVGTAYFCGAASWSAPGSTHCTFCPAGSYCPGTPLASTVILCPAGTWSKRAATACTSCGAGYACPQRNGELHRPIRCEPGTFSDVNAVQCTPCPAGFECPFTYNSTMTACRNGTFAFAQQPHCTLCSAGYYCPRSNPPAQFAMFGAANFAAQIPCPPGQYAPQGSSQCQRCPTGFFCSSQVASDGGRAPCPKGTFTADSSGTYASIDAVQCVQCPAGSDCSAGATSPTACTLGTYVTDAGCFPCRAGFYCVHPSLAPAPCHAGTWSSSNATSCSTCSAGYLCDPRSTTATPPGGECPIGSYCPAGVIAPTLCPAGTYGTITAAATAAATCVPCVASKFCPAGTAKSEGQKTCQEGHYCPEKSVAPVPCPGGTYSGALGALARSTCMACPEGFFCPPGSASFSQNACPPGFFCPTGTASAQENGCPSGTYASEHRLSTAAQCSQCPAGHRCPHSGLSAPIPCAPGEFQTQTGSTLCLACESGWACPNSGQTESFSTPCAVGHYCPTGTANPRAYPCPGGTYTFRTNLQTAGECEVCWRGYHCPRGTGDVPATPQKCDPGHYCPGAERRPVGRPQYISTYQGLTAERPNQFPCPPGTVSLATDIYSASQCAACPSGTYCLGGGLTNYSGLCDIGHYCPRGSSIARSVPCPAGTYNPSTGRAAVTDCLPCSAGYFCLQGSSVEQPCVAGTYYPAQRAEAAGPTLDVSARRCIVCPAGFICGAAATTPVACSAGFYSAARSDTCLTCNVGTYCPAAATAADQATRLFSCPPGLFCPAGMARYPTAETDACLPGYYCPLGTTTQRACPAGTYSPFSGRAAVAECLPCTAGMYCATSALTEPTGECQPGYYCPEGSTVAKQVACPSRYYRNKPRAEDAGFCAVCPRGFYCPTGTATPVLCPQGFYCITGTDNPQPCPIGSFGPSPGLRDQAECSACTAGFYCDGIGMSQPTGLCDPGYYCVSRSSTSAPPGLPIGGLCPKGGYCPPGSSFPTSCPEGTFNNFTGGSSTLDCRPCLPGYYCSGSNLPFPAGPCKAGYYCTGGAALPTQFRTPAGHFTGDGASNPIECEIGTFNPSPEQAACLPCPAGYYCPTRAMVTAIPCPPGGYCPAGSGLARACPPGSYSPQRFRQNVTDCIPCDPGMYCAAKNATAVSGPCQPGFYCKRGCVDAFCAYYLLAGGVARNLLDTSNFENTIGGSCPSGTYCGLATAVPQLCPLGTFRDAIRGTDVSQCSPCAPGFYCPSAGMATIFAGLKAPQPCFPGYYCPGTHLGTSPLVGCKDGNCLTYAESCNPMLNGCNAGGSGSNPDLGTGNPSARLCPTGFYCPEGSDRPLTCPILADNRTTYQPARGQTSCILCPAGRTCHPTNLLSLMVPQPCPEGFYCPPGTGLNPIECPAGSWSGDRNNLANESACAKCPAGRFCPTLAIVNRDTNSMPFCFGGFYCTEGAEDGFGMWGVNGGIGGICPMGYYCPNGTKFNTSFSCPPGTYKPTTGGSSSAACLECTPGMYCAGTGNIAATGPCSAGYYCPRSCSDAKCTNRRCDTGILPPPAQALPGGTCPQGHFCPPSSIFPQQCPVGSFQDLFGQSTCKPCPAGYFCSNATINPEPCGVGRFCPENTTDSSIPLCPIGTYQNTLFATNNSWCKLCPAGMYCPFEQMNTTTFKCQAGYYCVEGAAFANSTAGPRGGIGGQCPTGHYCPEGTRTATEFPCPSGTYNPNLGGQDAGSACLPCTPGKFCLGTGLSAVTGPCDAGYYCPTHCADSRCTNATCNAGGQACGAMPYANGGLCPPGHHCPQFLVGADVYGATNPTPCPAGSYAPIPGLAICYSCPNGKWCAENTTVPNTCPAGYYCARGTKYPNQWPCPRGTYANTIDNANITLCKLCPPGQYCEGLGNANPTGFCFGGYYCSLGASTPYGVVGDRGGIAGVCPSGHYCPNGTKYNNQFPCPAGTYNPLMQMINEFACLWCTPGMYCSGTGNWQTTGRCDAGYFCPRNCTDSTCSNMPCLTNLADPWASPYIAGGICPKGFHCPQTPTRGAIFPISCPVGTHASTTGKYACDICPAGYFCPTNTTDPIPCPAGSYCQQGSGFSIPKCPTGSFMPNTTAVNQSQCVACTAGWYCDGQGMDKPAALCAPGYYCTSGATSATGAINTARGGTAGPCPYGHYCPAGTRTSTEFPCAAGTYNPVMYGPNTDSCLGCTPGFYCANVGQANVTANCAAGYFCNNVNCTNAQCSNVCTGNCTLAIGGGPCPAGYACPLGTTAFGVPTVLNGTTTVRGNIVPVACPAGTHSAGQGASVCVACPAGYYCPIGSIAPQPIQCPAGAYCPAGTGSAPPLCPVGSYSWSVGLSVRSDCWLCAAGRYCASEGQTNVTGDCAQGYFCPGGASTQTGVPGPLGVVASEWGLDASNRSICPRGFFCPQASSAPSPCPAGTFNAIVGGYNVSGACTLCTGGSFCAVVNATAVSGTCLPGYACPSGCVDDRCYNTAVTLDKPTAVSLGVVFGDCPRGFYCPGSTATPIQCANGTFAPNPNAISCGPCPAGSYCPPGTFAPQVCPRGYYCPASTTVPVPCPAGSYGAADNLTQASSCTRCDAGRACTATGLTAPNADCAAGYFCTSGAAAVDGTIGSLGGAGGPCPMGRYCGVATSIPAWCGNGTFNPSLRAANETACLACTPGSYCNGEGLAAVSGPCSAGFYCPGGNTAPNEPERVCPVGTYCPPANVMPFECPAGTFNGLTQQTSSGACLPCTPGYYCEIRSQTPTGPCWGGYFCPGGNTVPNPVATPCLQRYYCPNASTTMLNCTAGSYCDVDKLEKPAGLCDPGYYCIRNANVPNPTDGSTGNICPVGTYCPRNSSFPSPCPAGTFNNVTGQSTIFACHPCSAGQFCGSNGLDRPTSPCAAGYYCPAGQSVPTPASYVCPIAHYCPAGTPNPILCGNGTHQDQQRQATCKLCPSGYYCEGYLNTSVPLPCPEGHYCLNGTQSANEFPCPIGTYSNKTGLRDSTECAACPPGLYCAIPGQTKPTGPCHAGFFCVGGAFVPNPTDITTGNTCPVGRYCINGTSVPLRCPIGTYSNSVGLTAADDCTKCTPGWYCAATGLTTPTAQCTEGFYCPEGESSPNRLPCPWGQVCATGSASWQHCPSGTHSMDIGKVNCTTCPSGFFCDSQMPCNRYATGVGYGFCNNHNYTCPRACPLGYFCPPGTRHRHQYPCPAGRFGPSLSLTHADNCTLCPPGRYCQQAGTSVASDSLCQGGSWCIGGATIAAPNDGTTGINCPVGHYCPDGTPAPEKCPAGTFNNNTGAVNATDCTECTPGFACTAAGLVAPDVACTQGFYCPGGQDTPTPAAYVCPFGWHCPAGSVAPVNCPSGYASLNVGLWNCTLCPAGYYCSISELINNRTTPITCPLGHYCPSGTKLNTEFPCPPGTVRESTGATSINQCTPCPAGKGCPNWGTGTDAPNCTAGYVCLGGANTTTPTDNVTGRLCPVGSYCVAGSSVGELCPAGTLGIALGYQERANCIPCPGGRYCAAPGLSTPTGVCDCGFECPGGQVSPRPGDHVCPGFKTCPAGTTVAENCPDGFYNGEQDNGTCTCKPCPPGMFCRLTDQVLPEYGSQTFTHVLPTPCPAGHWCPGGSSFPKANPCGTGLVAPVPGKYSNETGLSSPTQCRDCPPGHYCFGTGLTKPTGLCGQGFYCNSGNTIPNPDSPAVSTLIGGRCKTGRYCPMGSQSDGIRCPAGTFNDVEYATNESYCKQCAAGRYCQSLGLSNPLGTGACQGGFFCPGGQARADPPERVCPAGWMCPTGSAAPVPCPGGSYQPEPGKATCVPCNAYFYCPANTSTQLPCFPSHYCPAGTEYPNRCPAGTRAPNDLAMGAVAECQSCPAGKYCDNGTISGDCNAGWYCAEGNTVSTPDSATDNTNTSLGSIKIGGQCPKGSYCPAGTTAPISCPAGTFGLSAGLKRALDCTPCSPGYYCPITAPEPIPCSPGSYCPGAAETAYGNDGILPCPRGTYNPQSLATDASFCLPCDAGYFCPYERMANGTAFPTPPGFYSDAGQAEPYPCPGGTYQALGNGAAATSSVCRSCSSGHFCNASTAFELKCPLGTFCPASTAFPFQCPGGSFCELGVDSPSQCPAGYSCEPLTSTPRVCRIGFYCPIGTEIPIPCPFGFVGVQSVENRTSLRNSCRPCGAGEWATNGITCKPCAAGHVCLGATPTPTPRNVTTENGFACPLGHYCPEGSAEATPCPPGYFNNKTGAGSLANCTGCPANFFNPEYGSPTCKSCGRSSVAKVGSPVCHCAGENRAFQPEDSSCRCKPGFVFYSDGQRLSEEDAEFDCVPIVYETCAPSQVRSAFGSCVDINSEAVCEMCVNGSGTVDPQIGICICDAPELDELVCDKTCRLTANRMFVDMSNNSLVFVNPVTRDVQSVRLDGASILGKKACNQGQQSCQVRMLQLDVTGMKAVFNPTAAHFALADPLSAVSRSASVMENSRRAVNPNAATTLNNPIVCLNNGETLFWDISSSNTTRDHFPVYQKDNMLNTNPNFDYTEFRLLAEKVRAPALQLKSFMFTFEEPGVYVFADNANKYQITIVRVVSASESCPNNTPFQTMSQTALVQLGAIRRDERQLAPDWVLIGVLMAGLFLLVSGVIGGLWHFRRQTWGLVGSSLPRYRNLGMEHLSNVMAARMGNGKAQGILARMGNVLGGSSGATEDVGIGSVHTAGAAVGDESDAMPAPPGSSRPIALRLDQHLAEFEPSEFIAIIAEEAGVLNKNVLILSVTEGSTIVRFVITGCGNAQDAANLLVNRISDETNEVHSKLPILAFDASQESDMVAGQHPAYVMQSIEDSYWDYERRIDLEGFNVRTLYDKLEDQTIHIVSQLTNQRDDLLALCDKILIESETLKDMFFRIRVEIEDRQRRERNLIDLRERQLQNGKVEYDVPEDLKWMLTNFLNDFFKTHVQDVTNKFQALSRKHLEEGGLTPEELKELKDIKQMMLSGDLVAPAMPGSGKNNTTNVGGRHGVTFSPGAVEIMDDDDAVHSSRMASSASMGPDGMLLDNFRTAAGAAAAHFQKPRTMINPMEFPVELRDDAQDDIDERFNRGKKREAVLLRKLDRLRRATDFIVMPVGLDDLPPAEGVVAADDVPKRDANRKEWQQACRGQRSAADGVPAELRDDARLTAAERYWRSQKRELMLVKRLRELRDGLAQIDVPEHLMEITEGMSPEEIAKQERKRNEYIERKLVKLRRSRANAMVPIEFMDDSDLDDDTRGARQSKAESHADQTVRNTAILPDLPSELDEKITAPERDNRHAARNTTTVARLLRAKMALDADDMPEGLSDRSDIDDAERAKRAALRGETLDKRRDAHRVAAAGRGAAELAADQKKNATAAAAAAAAAGKKRDEKKPAGSGDRHGISAAVAAAMSARGGLAGGVDIPAEFQDDVDLDEEDRRRIAAQRNAYLKGRKSKFNDKPPHENNDRDDTIDEETRKQRAAINDAFIRGQAAMFGLSPSELSAQSRRAIAEARELRDDSAAKAELKKSKELHNALLMPEDFKGSTVADLRKRQAFLSGKRAAALLGEPDEMLEDLGLTGSDAAASAADMHAAFRKGKESNLMVAAPLHMQGNAPLELAFEMGRDVQRGKEFDEYLDIVRREGASGEDKAAALANMFQRGRVAAGVISVPEEFASDPAAVRAFRIGLAGGELKKDATATEKAAHKKGLAARLQADFMMPDELRDDVPMLSDHEVRTRRELQAAFKEGQRMEAATKDMSRVSKDDSVNVSDRREIQAAFEAGMKAQKQADDVPSDLEEAVGRIKGDDDSSTKARAAKAERAAFIKGRHAAHMAAAVTELVPEMEGISATQRNEILDAFTRGETAQKKMNDYIDEIEAEPVGADAMSAAERDRKMKQRHAFQVGRQAIAASTYASELNELTEERELMETLAKNGPDAIAADKVAAAQIAAKSGSKAPTSAAAGVGADEAKPLTEAQKAAIAAAEEEFKSMRKDHQHAFAGLQQRQKLIASTEMAQLEEELAAEAKHAEFELNEIFERERAKLGEKHRLEEISAAGKGLTPEQRAKQRAEMEELVASQEADRKKFVEEHMRQAASKRDRLAAILKNNAKNEQRLLRGLQKDQEAEMKRLHDESVANAASTNQTLGEEFKIQQRLLQEKLQAHERRSKAKARAEKDFLDQNLREKAALERDNLDSNIREKEALKLHRHEQLSKLGLMNQEELVEAVDQTHKEASRLRDAEMAALAAKTKTERMSAEQELHEKQAADRKKMLGDAQGDIKVLVDKSKAAQQASEAAAPKLGAGVEKMIKMRLDAQKRQEEEKERIRKEQEEAQLRAAKADKRVQDAVRKEIEAREAAQGGKKLSAEQAAAIMDEYAKNSALLDQQRNEDAEKQKSDHRARLDAKRQAREAESRRREMEVMKKKMEQEEAEARAREEALKPKINDVKVVISQEAISEEQRLKAEAEARLLELRKKHDAEISAYNNSLEGDLAKQKAQQDQRAKAEHDRKLAELKRKQDEKLGAASSDDEKKKLQDVFEAEKAALEKALNDEASLQKEKFDAQLEAKKNRRKQQLEAKQRQEEAAAREAAEDQRNEIMITAALAGEKAALEQLLAKDPNMAADEKAQQEMAQAMMGRRQRKELQELVERQARRRQDEKANWKRERQDKIASLQDKMDQEVHQMVVDMPLSADRDQKIAQLRADKKKDLVQATATLEKELDEEEQRRENNFEVEMHEEQFNLKLKHLNQISVLCGLASPDEAMAQIQARLNRRAQEEQERELLAQLEAKQKEAVEAEAKLAAEKDEFERQLNAEFEQRRKDREEEMKRREREFAAKLQKDKREREQKALKAATAAVAGDSKQAQDLRKQLVEDGNNDDSRLRAYMMQEHERQKAEVDGLLAEKRARLAARRRAAANSATGRPTTADESPSSLQGADLLDGAAADTSMSVSGSLAGASPAARSLASATADALAQPASAAAAAPTSTLTTDALSTMLDSMAATPAPVAAGQQQGGNIVISQGAGGAMMAPMDANAMNQWAQIVVLQVQQSPLWEKLNRIEKVLKQQSELGLISYYVDAKDKSIQENEGRLVRVDAAKLDAAQFTVFVLGKSIVEGLKKNGFALPSVTFGVASALPKCSGPNISAFCHSYAYDDMDRALYFRDTRLATIGEFTVVVIHALAHMMAQRKQHPNLPVSQDMWNDADPAFLTEYYALMQAATEEMLFMKMQNAKRDVGRSGKDEAARPASIVSAETLAEIEKVIKGRKGDDRENAVRALLQL